MKSLIAILPLLVVLTFCFTQNAQADFGSFFTDEAPAALEGTPQDILSEILAIEPAAGDEEDVTSGGGDEPVNEDLDAESGSDEE